jgi:MYXO-CTERM domain-containing protein
VAGAELSHGERVGNTCDICTNCDFTVKLGCAGGGKLVNQPCAANADCCAGLTCQLWSYSGQAPYQTNCCKAVGQACTLNTECCGGSNCSGGSCACVAAGQWCLNDADCCAGMVCDISGSPKCAPPPPPPDLAGAVDLARGPIGDGAARGDAARGGGDGGAASDGGDEGSVMGGCGCRVGGARAASSPWMFALLAALALAAARRKR